jgi:serine/threonine-protein kinase
VSTDVQPRRPRIPVQWREVVAGRYLVEEPLGAGGGGVVVAATHLFLGERVALKLVTAGADSKATERLLLEARVTAKLRSDHVVRVLDAGIAKPGILFVAMELLPGVDLRKRLAVVGRLSVETAIGYALGVCDALRQAHALGVVHRDIKPSNLFLAARAGEEEVIKVLDFGASKRLPPPTPSGASEDVTASGTVIGSLCYMAPEQLAAAPVDARADVWSLAAVVFECLAGNPPYRGRALGEYAAALGAAKGPPPLRELRDDVPPALDEALRRALAIDPDDRTPSIDAFAGDLAAVV